MTQHIPLLAPIRTALIHSRVHSAPKRGARSRRHGQYTPICAEVLYAPNDADDDGREAEDSAVPGANERGHGGEARGVVLAPAGCEEDLAEREDECGCEEEGDARDGEALWGCIERGEGGHAVCEGLWAAAVLVGWRGGREDVGEGAGEEACERGCYGDDGDVGGGCGVGDDVGGGQGVDYGAQVVDEGFAGPGDEDEAAREPPHSRVHDVAARLFIQQPRLLALLLLGLRFQVLSFRLQEVEGGVGQIVGGHRAVAVVVGGLGEELVVGEQAGALELVDGLVDHLALVHDAQGEEADAAHGEEQDAEEEEEAEHVDVASAAVRILLVENAAADLALPHTAEPEGGDGDGQSDALGFSSPKVLRACRHCGQVHAGCAHAHERESQHHDADGPAMAPSRRRRAALVRICCEQVRQAKEDARQRRGYAGPQAVAEVAKDGHGQVQAQLGAYGDGIDLELRVPQPRLEEVAVEREGGDAARAETVEDGPDKGQPAQHKALHLLAVALQDALGYLLEEATCVAGVLAAAVRGRVGVVGGKQRAVRGVLGEVVELVDGSAAIAIAGVAVEG